MNSKLLTAYQRRRLRHALHHARNTHHYYRILAILEYDKGKSIEEVAQTLDVSGRSIYNWLDAYGADRHPGALEDAYRSGRPRLCDKQTERILKGLLTSLPEQFGYTATNWTVPLLQEQVKHMTGLYLSDETVRRELQRLGYLWKRPRYVLCPDPDLEKKKKNYSPDQGIAFS